MEVSLFQSLLITEVPLYIYIALMFQLEHVLHSTESICDGEGFEQNAHMSITWCTCAYHVIKHSHESLKLEFSSSPRCWIPGGVAPPSHVPSLTHVTPHTGGLC